ncbi:hypothetical protein P9112_003143 [Eukaryota sp. TZLM1-RC]
MERFIATSTETVGQPAVVQFTEPETLSQIPQEPRLLGVTPSNTPIAPQYSSNLLMDSVTGLYDRYRDRQRKSRPRKYTFEAKNSSDPVGNLYFIDKFILYTRIQNTIEERNINEADPSQVRLAKKVFELSRQLEELSHPPTTSQSISKGKNLFLNQRNGNSLHEWNRFRAAAQVDPRRIASCVTPKCLAAIRAEDIIFHYLIAFMLSKILIRNRFGKSFFNFTQYSTLKTARNNCTVFT